MENNTKKLVAITTVIIITTILGGLEIMCIDAIGVDNILNTVKDPLKMTLYTGRVIKFLTLCVLTVCMIYIAYRLYELFIDVYKFNSDVIQKKKAQKKVAQKNVFALVNLGLPSGTLWADRNLGANAPEQYGNYYRFGETVRFTEKSPEYVYDKIEGNIAGTDRDAATVNLGKNYRMPTFDQIIELLEECTWTWTEQNGVNGMKVTGPNGNSIFLPALGYRNSSSVTFYSVGSNGYYWSASPSSDCSGRFLSFYSGSWGWGDSDRADWLPIRPVTNKEGVKLH